MRLAATRDRAGALSYLVEGGYSPLDWQLRAHLQDVSHPALRPQKLAICGLGAGKTDFGVAECASLGMLNPAVPGLITAPTFDLLKHETIERWRALMDDMARAKLPLSRRYHKTDKVDEWWDGTKVFFRSMENIRAQRGRQYGWCWPDEIESLVDPGAAWSILSGRVRHKLARVREMLGTSTPRGMRGTIEMFVRARQKVRAAETKQVIDGVEYIEVKVRKRTVLVPRMQALAAWYTIRATSEDNPYLDDDYFTALEGYSERRYREEVLAEVLQPESLVWPEFDARVHGVNWPRQWVKVGTNKVGPNPKFDRSLEWDLAYDTGDSYPHALFIQRHPDGTCVIVDEYCDDGKSLTQNHDEIMWRAKMFGRQPSYVIGDRAVPEELGWMSDTFPNAVPKKMVRRIEQDILTGIELVRDRISPYKGSPKILIAQHLIDVPGRRGIWKCAKGYRHAQKADGGLDSRPYKDNVHDHGADALRMHQVALFGEGARARIFSMPRAW